MWYNKNQTAPLRAERLERDNSMEKNYRAELTAVFGDPVDGNPTGVMEEVAYEALGLNYRYLTLRVKKEDLEAAVKGAKAFGMKGYNLTMPHKTAVIPYLDCLTPAAEIIGAVNTVVCRNGKWTGENTDGKGFVLSLKRDGIKPEGKRITLLGAGGAARAIGVECALAGAEHITVLNRDAGRGEELAGLIGRKTGAEAEFCPWTEQARIPEGTDILIQATCVGLYPDSGRKPDIAYDTVTDRMVVCDVVFNPERPLFLQEAERRGARIVTGMGMLVHQGALNFELWTGKKAPLEIMYQALAREFGASQIGLP